MTRPCDHPDENLPLTRGRYVKGSCRVCWLWVNDPRYRAMWTGPNDRPAAPRTPAAPAESPGTELKALLEAAGVPQRGCRCASRMAQMNSWGLEGCREHRDEILSWLREEATTLGWWARLRVGVTFLATYPALALSLDLADPAPGLLDEAIRRAEEKAAAVETPPEPTPPPPSSPGKVWAYGVTTCAQRLYTSLPVTLASLARSGFPHPRLFVDGCHDHELDDALRTYERTCRYPALQIAGNLTLALWELYHRDPHADRYAVFQDDCLACAGLRAYLDSCDYPLQGYWNLYTYAGNHKVCPKGHHGWYESDQLGKGAVGLVFDRTTLLTLLGSPELLGRPQDGRRGHKAIDGGIVHALKRAGWREYVHNPSLLQHTGVESIQNPLRHKSQVMSAPNWIGSLGGKDTEDVSAIMSRLKG